MTERPDLREIVGDEVSEEELRKLSAVDALLRSVPGPPPEVPATLAHAVRSSTATEFWGRRHLSVAAVIAAVLAAMSVGVGAWLGGSPSFESQREIKLAATDDAPGASGRIRLGAAEQEGNWTLELETAGLPELPAGGYYVLWLAQDGEYAGPCGTFRAGEGVTTVRMNASYRLDDYDEWVVTAVRPGDPDDAEPPWLLHAPIEQA